MRAVDQWKELERTLPEGFEEARLSFTVEDPAAVAAAAGVLAPLGPGRVGNQLRFHVAQSGSSGTESVRNLLTRLDRKRIWGTVSLVDVQSAETSDLAAPGHKPSGRRSLASAWDELVSNLPSDWSDLLCELEVDSTDYLPRAALHGAPLNPTRNPEIAALRFRVSRKGYGASPGMARRCLERMDAEGITGRVTVLQALSETGYAATLGPVWRVAGRSV
ncbi:hypothetical protein BH09ACT13_BH09ACT13_00060 [soil metagenome]